MSLESRIDDTNKRIDDLTKEIHSALMGISGTLSRLDERTENQNKMISVKTFRVLVIALVAALGAAGFVKADVTTVEKIECIDAGVDAGVDAGQEN